jgi:hypothetical protein
MPAGGHSTDIWDYLNEMPYMPARAGRDTLIRFAQASADGIKRVRIWDYFFQIRKEDVGKPQLREIELRRQQKQTAQKKFDRQAQDARALFNKTRSQANLAAREKFKRGLIGVVAIVLVFVMAYLLKQQTLWYVGAAVFAATLGWYGFFYRVLWNLLRVAKRQHDATFEKLQAELNQAFAISDHEIRLLAQEIDALRQQIPTPPPHEEIARYLQDDLDALIEQSFKRTGLDRRQTANVPYSIFGPAELQKRDRIPKPLREPTDGDGQKHLTARQSVTLRDGKWIDLHGVYYVEILIIAPDVFANYGCFFDFINGETMAEHSSEQYYDSIVSLKISREYREISVGNQIIGIDDSPTFGLTLLSQDKIEVTFPTRGYFAGLSRAGIRSAEFDLDRWALNPDDRAEEAIRALRIELRRRRRAEDPTFASE